MYNDSIESVEQTTQQTFSKAKTVAIVLIVSVLYFGIAMSAMAQSESASSDTVAAQTTTKADDKSVFRYQPGPTITYSSDNDVRNAGDNDIEELKTSTTVWARSPYLRQYKLAVGARFSGNLAYADGTPSAKQTNDAKYKFAAVRVGTDLLASPALNVTVFADARMYETGYLDSLWQSFAAVTYTEGKMSAEFYPGVYAKYERLDSAAAFIETILTYKFNDAFGLALYSSEEHALSLETGDHLEGIFGPAVVYNFTPALSGLITVGNDFAIDDGETVVRIRLEGTLL
jgi:hypothetical protein